jgi:hypothetical protein
MLFRVPQTPVKIDHIQKNNDRQTWLAMSVPGLVLVVTRVRSTTTSAHEAAGALGIRRSPRPLLGGRFINASGASRREIAKLRLMNASAPHTQSSSPAKAGDPVLRDADDGIERPQRTGCPACAGHDSVVRGGTVAIIASASAPHPQPSSPATRVARMRAR